MKVRHYSCYLCLRDVVRHRPGRCEPQIGLPLDPYLAHHTTLEQRRERARQLGRRPVEDVEHALHGAAIHRNHVIYILCDQPPARVAARKLVSVPPGEKAVTRML